jgi:pyrroline-5-carboxylate reductase
MEAKNRSIAIVGAGNLGTSLVNGLLDSNNFSATSFSLSKRKITSLSTFREKGCIVTNNNRDAVKNADIVVLAVLPQKIDEVLSEIATSLNENQLIISLVTGVKVVEIQTQIGNNIPVVRAMPNTAIAIRESMTCISTSSQWKGHIPIVKDVFEQVGETVIINEDQMTSATALCACGIAFFLRAIRAATQGGTEIDFHASVALKMAAQTAKGAASLLLENNSHPEDEIDKVTSPKGCTIAGLNEMEHSGFSSSFIKGITTSAEKAKGLY